MSQELPLISVIIPTFNRAELIGETLESVLKQTYPNWECIIVDDGSKDATKAIVKKFENKDARFKCYSRPSDRLKGANACRNFGYKMSKGIYINWFDSDDIMKVDKMELDVNDLTQSSSDFVVSQSDFFEKTLHNLTGQVWNTQLLSDAILDDFITKNIGWSTNAPLWRRSSLEKVDLKFNERLQNGQDYLFHAEALLAGLQPTLGRGVRTFMRDHGDKISNNKLKTPSKALINLWLLSYKYRLAWDTFQFLEVQAHHNISSFFKHKMWKEGILYGTKLLGRPISWNLRKKVIKLSFLGTFFKIFHIGYSKL